MFVVFGRGFFVVLGRFAGGFFVVFFFFAVKNIFGMFFTVFFSVGGFYRGFWLWIGFRVFLRSLSMVVVIKFLLGFCLFLKISFFIFRVFLRRGFRLGFMNLVCRSWKRVGRRWAFWGFGV